MCALILGVLGVSRDDILEDYLLTNQHADHDRLIDRLGKDGERFRKIGPEVFQPLLSADADYLAAMYESLDRDHGGVDGYVASLGVDAAAKTRLRELLLD